MKRTLGFILVGLLLLTGCEIEVRRIVIDIEPGNVTVAPGETVAFTATTTSSRQSNFSWRADGGRFDEATGETVMYTAPDSEGTYTVNARPLEGGNDFVEGSAEVTVRLTENVEPVTATTSATTLLKEVAVPARGSVVFEVTVPASVQRAGSALVIELNRELPLGVYNADRQLFATSKSATAFGAGNTGLTGTVETQDITISSKCRGSCVVQDAPGSSATTHYAQVKNPGEAEVTVGIYAFVRNYDDNTEPANNERAEAPSLTTDEGGAIESLGDEDFFRVGANGSVIFTPFAQVTIALKAEVVDAVGASIVNLPPDTRVQVTEGSFIRVYVEGGNQAAATNASRYALELTNP